MTFDSLLSWAVDAVTQQYVPNDMDEILPDLDTALTAHLETLNGKDQGWWAEQQANGEVVVERRFTQRRGMSYAPVTFAWTVRRTLNGKIEIKPNSTSALRFMGEGA